MEVRKVGAESGVGVLVVSYLEMGRVFVAELYWVGLVAGVDE